MIAAEWHKPCHISVFCERNVAERRVRAFFVFLKLAGNCGEPYESVERTPGFFGDADDAHIPGTQRTRIRIFPKVRTTNFVGKHSRENKTCRPGQLVRHCFGVFSGPFFPSIEYKKN